VTLRVGLDIGGTKSVAAIVDERGLAGPVETIATPVTSADDLIAAVVSLVQRVAGAGSIEGLGVGVAGLVDRESRTVLFAPHLPLTHEPFADRLEQRVGVPVALENDNTAAAWGEWLIGAGVGSDPMVFVGLGTGIGGGVVLDGRLQRGATGLAGEFGHLPFDPRGPACACGAVGCWEVFASGNALGRGSALLSIAGSVAGITGRHVSAAAAAGDALAGEVMENVGRDLGIGLAGLVAAYDPSLVVVGGGLSAMGDALLVPAQAALNERVIGAGYRTTVPVVAGRFGPQASLVGAGLLPAP
jgi:glucokinase